MTDETRAKRLEEWLATPPGTAPPEDLDEDVLAAVYALRPDRAPAARVTLDDILGSVREGPFAVSTTGAVEQFPSGPPADAATGPTTVAPIALHPPSAPIPLHPGGAPRDNRPGPRSASPTAGRPADAGVQPPVKKRSGFPPWLYPLAGVGFAAAAATALVLPLVSKPTPDAIDHVATEAPAATAVAEPPPPPPAPPPGAPMAIPEVASTDAIDVSAGTGSAAPAADPTFADEARKPAKLDLAASDERAEPDAEGALGQEARQASGSTAVVGGVVTPTEATIAKEKESEKKAEAIAEVGAKATAQGGDSSGKGSYGYGASSDATRTRGDSLSAPAPATLTPAPEAAAAREPAGRAAANTATPVTAPTSSAAGGSASPGAAKTTTTTGASGARPAPSADVADAELDDLPAAESITFDKRAPTPRRSASAEDEDGLAAEEEASRASSPPRDAPAAANAGPSALATRAQGVPLDYNPGWYQGQPDVAAIYSSAAALEQSGRWADAVLLYKPLYNDRRTDVALDAAWRGAKAQWAGGDGAGALATVSSALARAGGPSAFRAHLLVLRGDIYNAQGRTAEARRAWSEAALANGPRYSTEQADIPAAAPPDK